jgi:citrate lyase subunit beta/citryl-CoA lyase
MRWRSVLFVPGNRPDFAAKVERWSPDVVVIDLEDAVPSGEKDAARSLAVRAAEQLIGTLPVCIRVNAPSSEWFDSDVAALPPRLTAVVVPKWEQHIPLALPVVAGVESVRGVVDSMASLDPPVVACYFGAEDYIADLGGHRTASNIEVIQARSSVAVSARLAGIVAIDMATLDFHDAERFETEGHQARAMGYGGKLCIHPQQVALANHVFAPSVAEVQRARRLLAAFEDDGCRTISFEGTMVDEVVAALARAVLQRAESAEGDPDD